MDIYDIPLWARKRAADLSTEYEWPVSASFGTEDVKGSRHLQAFAAYIAAHEDPPVDPLLIEARRIIAADYSQREYEGPSERCLDGSCDESFVMRTTLAALRRGMALSSKEPTQ